MEYSFSLRTILIAAESEINKYRNRSSKGTDPGCPPLMVVGNPTFNGLLTHAEPEIYPAARQHLPTGFRFLYT